MEKMIDINRLYEELAEIKRNMITKKELKEILENNKREREVEEELREWELLGMEDSSVFFEKNNL